MPITEQQVHDLVGVLAAGCPVETALEATGVSPAEFELAMHGEPQFPYRAHRAGALTEVRQLQNVRLAGNEPKNWRASVWWLERCRGHRYLAKAPRTITEEQFAAFRSDIARLVDREVRHADDHDRLIAGLGELSIPSFAAERFADSTSTTIYDQ
ncbi:hypothetical protein NG895_17790 [Aeoliella sp. ICT_H6.2]|uniref:Uncharacterized protein n=1 Tax=Aeoliella straminimaris TaxID=2954799 RepID=A0A9X2FCN2_9BACT|nr:hypothetical protein [Aeoliella straminimaris]MCO6045753.1 hypothetical protein [Aeoliella straminimaris]